MSFRIAITPDCYTEARGRFEAPLEETFRGVPNLEYGPMPPQPGNVAQPATLNEYDGIFCMLTRFTRDSMAGVERLSIVSRWGVGYDMIDVAALTEAGVVLAITPKAVRRPVAESILSFIFALSTGLFVQDRVVRQGLWRGDVPKPGRSVGGKVLGSVGCGNIARELFRISQSLGFSRMIAHDPLITPESVRDLGVELVPMEDVFRLSDYVTINVPLNSQTRGLVGDRLLRMMKPSAYFINTARGALVQEAALVRAIEEGWIAGAGLDVFDPEPLPADSRLRTLDNVILTPHSLAWTVENSWDMTQEACENLVAMSRGEVPAAVVNREVLDQPAFQRKLERFKLEA